MLSMVCGWIFVTLLVVLFSDMVGVIRVVIFKEKSCISEIAFRKFTYKFPLAILFALMYLVLR